MYTRKITIQPNKNTGGGRHVIKDELLKSGDNTRMREIKTNTRFDL